MKEASWEEVFDGKSKVEIIFFKKATAEILELVGNKLNESKEIVDDNGNQQKAFLDDDTITGKQLGAIATGSKIFIRNNLASFYDFLEYKRNEHP